MAEHRASRRSTRSRRTVVQVLVALVALTIGLGALVSSADANHRPTSKQIPNLGVVKNQIKAYYGDYVDASGAHQAASTSDYAKEVKGVEAKAIVDIAKRSKHLSGKPAVVFDVDDTTLLTYNYEAANDFGYNPAINAQYVLGEKFPAVFGMTTLVNGFKSHGVAVFFITGRPNAQHAATLGNLSAQGYPAPTVNADGDGLYTKPDSGQPFASYVDCNLDGIPDVCSTTDYKASTRKHIESLGYDIVGNFGDQFSDLNGGYANVSVKMPNPMYYLP
jgi:predicted secreted acid phosphatase